MPKGIQITSGKPVSDASDVDFVLNTMELGGMHVKTIKTFRYKDAKVDNTKTLPYMYYEHGLDFVPAFIAYGIQGILPGVQNSVDYNDTVYVEGKSLFLSFGTGSDITLIVFAEQLEVLTLAN